MKMKRKAICLVLVSMLLCNMSLQSFAASSNVLSQQNLNDDIIHDYMNIDGLTQFSIQSEPTIVIPNKIYLSEDEAGRLPGVTISIYMEPDLRTIMPRAYGEGYVIGRAKSWMTASDGYIRKGYKQGTFASIASTVLSFIPSVPTTTISAILSVVGLTASSNDMVSGETLISYRYLYRDGEGRWSSDPNTNDYWHLGLRTGRRETYKHVIGGKLNSTTQKWNYQVKNYTTAIKTEDSTNYSKSDTWLAEQGRQYVATGNVYIETSW